MRILLKLSGEQLAGDNGQGFDIERARWIANEVKKARDETGAEIAVIVGGGNMVRGESFAGEFIGKVQADYMGMLSGMINTIGLGEVFNNSDLPTVSLSVIEADQVIDQYTTRRAISHLEKGRVVLIGGGVGRPFHTHDSAAVIAALELDCDLVAKSTKVDGVFDSDPAKNPDAKKLDRVSFDEAVSNNQIRVMDKTALALAADNKKPIVVFELLREGNIARIARGEGVGTRIG